VQQGDASEKGVSLCYLLKYFVPDFTRWILVAYIFIFEEVGLLGENYAGEGW